MSKRGQDLAEEGAQLSLLAQVEREPDWGHRARELTLDFLGLVVHETFTAEDLRKYCHKRGLSEPKEPRVWGAIMADLRRSGRITRVGWGTSENDQAHYRPVAVWRVKLW